ncbi:hypothetical protein AMECASPLE_023358 [Ameca splendens]|uniref:Uncharacterized protein n=1 Tax=Ameca splendens TaxID=208324 RepID=A0ABV0YQZ7_9TELE
MGSEGGGAANSWQRTAAGRLGEDCYPEPEAAGNAKRQQDSRFAWLDESGFSSSADAAGKRLKAGLESLRAGNKTAVSPFYR